MRWKKIQWEFTRKIELARFRAWSTVGVSQILGFLVEMNGFKQVSITILIRNYEEKEYLVENYKKYWFYEMVKLSAWSNVEVSRILTWLRKLLRNVESSRNFKLNPHPYQPWMFFQECNRNFFPINNGTQFETLKSAHVATTQQEEQDSRCNSMLHTHIRLGF